MEFQANFHTYNMGYYLADGIYPKWITFVKLIVKLQSKKQLDFHNAQASARKNIRRALRILQTQFAIVRRSARF